jgi:hypothetical protein
MYRLSSGQCVERSSGGELPRLQGGNLPELDTADIVRELPGGNSTRTNWADQSDQLHELWSWEICASWIEHLLLVSGWERLQRCECQQLSTV